MGNIDLVNGETDGTGVDDLLGLGVSPTASEYVGRLELVEETEKGLTAGLSFPVLARRLLEA